MSNIFFFAMGILAALGYYYWSFWAQASHFRKHHECSCGRAVDVVTYVISGGSRVQNILTMPQCETCYEWMLHGQAYNHPPWSQNVQG